MWTTPGTRTKPSLGGSPNTASGRQTATRTSRNATTTKRVSSAMRQRPAFAGAPEVTTKSRILARSIQPNLRQVFAGQHLGYFDARRAGTSRSIVPRALPAVGQPVGGCLRAQAA